MISIQQGSYIILSLSHRSLGENLSNCHNRAGLLWLGSILLVRTCSCWKGYDLWLWQEFWAIFWKFVLKTALIFWLKMKKSYGSILRFSLKRVQKHKKFYSNIFEKSKIPSSRFFITLKFYRCLLPSGREQKRNGENKKRKRFFV